MRRVILASHGSLAEGALDTLHMIVGPVEGVYAFSLKRNDVKSVSDRVRALLDTFSPDDRVFVVTDMVGSSVNNDMVGLLADHPEITLLSGLNMPLVLGLVLNEDLEGSALGQTIDTARENIKNCSLAISEAEDDEGDDL